MLRTTLQLGRKVAVTTVAAAAVITPVTATASPEAQTAKIVTAASLTGPAYGAYGSTVTLTGVLWRYGTSYRIGNSTVYLQRSPHGRATWSSVASGRTSGSGTFAFSVTQTGGYDYRALFRGSTTFAGALSNIRYPATTHKVILDSLSTTNSRTGTLRATGRVYPAVPKGQPVHLQYRLSNGSWRTAGSASGTGSATVSVNATAGGSALSWRLYAPMRYPYGAGASAGRTLVHYVWRGAFGRPWNTYYHSNGTIRVWSKADAPARNLASYQLNYQGAVYTNVNTAGCLRITANGAAPAGNAGYVSIGLLNNGIPLDDARVNPGTSSQLSGDLRNTPQVSFQVYSPNGTTQLQASLYALCNTPSVS